MPVLLPTTAPVTPPSTAPVPAPEAVFEGATDEHPAPPMRARMVPRQTEVRNEWATQAEKRDMGTKEGVCPVRIKLALS